MASKQNNLKIGGSSLPCKTTAIYGGGGGGNVKTKKKITAAMLSVLQCIYTLCLESSHIL